MKHVFLNIELYTEGELFCAYIGEDGSSGYECVGSTPEQCAEQVKEYIRDKFVR